MAETKNMTPMKLNPDFTKVLLKKNHLLIILSGSLIGLNETLVGSAGIPYHSVVLSTITLVLLSLARFYIPGKGTSLAIIGIALLFKMNSMGIHACTAPSTPWRRRIAF